MKRRMTKTQRRRNASKKSKQGRIAKALRTFLRSVNKDTGAAKVLKNPGGSITIIPIKVKRGRR